MTVLIMNKLPITFSVWLFIDLFYYYNLKIKVTNNSFVSWKFRFTKQNIFIQTRNFIKEGILRWTIKIFPWQKLRNCHLYTSFLNKIAFVVFSACRGSPKINDTKITWQSCSRHKICALLVDKVSLLQNVYAKLIFFKFI